MFCTMLCCLGHYLRIFLYLNKFKYTCIIFTVRILTLKKDGIFILVSNTQISWILGGAADSMPISHSCDTPSTHFSPAICFGADDRLNGRFQ